MLKTKTNIAIAMKKNRNILKVKPLTIFALLLFFNIILVNQGLSQIKNSPGFNSKVPIGQRLYTQNSKGEVDLKPYKSTHYETFGTTKRKIIEIGDFVIKEEVVNGESRKDTLWFAISKMTIIGQDTLQEMKKIELAKINTYLFEAKISFSTDKIFVSQSEKYQQSAFAKLKKQKAYVHPDDTGLYFKLEQGEKFKFESRTTAISILTIPFRVRMDSGIDSIKASSDFKLNNIELLLGFQTSTFEYKNNKLRHKKFMGGAYFGPTAIKLTNNNSTFGVDREITRLGITYGIAFLGSINSVNLGIALGAESMLGNNSSNWIYNNKPYIGIVGGFSLNSL
ncbi:MAG: hypothetical protein ACI8VT_004234 [Saprospiraceae bacterium]|jgi:hypothetical protein